jgi:hypothetical protein
MIEEMGRVSERRRKRLFMPAIYLLAEVVVFWLALSLIQLKFTFTSWSAWSILLFLLAVSYAVLKTIHVYKRQKDYPTTKEARKI